MIPVGLRTFHSAGAMSVLDCLKWRAFSIADEEDRSTEGKQGIPRFDGDAIKLSEYHYRVRMRQLREKNQDQTEVKKLGPLGLRLVDGLRGPALQVARSLHVEKLASEEGPVYLMENLTKAFKPRAKQEARELYQAGAQVGGVLSRQFGESIPSYVLRRKTWYRMLTDLNSELTLPEVILAEQVLLNASIGSDHQLMIRTALGGDTVSLTVDAVCSELLAQHGRIHEAENARKANRDYASSGKSYSQNKGYKGSRKGYHRPWKAHYVEDYEDTEWEANSQSLGGYEEYEEDNGCYYTEDLADDDVITALYSEMCEQGLDENNVEAMEFASEILQAESEAFYLRNRAFVGGHNGFTKQYNVKGGHLTLEERKQRIASLKSSSVCRTCGETGHWSGDPQCKKGGGKKGKGKGKKGSGSGKGYTKSSASSSEGKGSKPRSVFFTINEYYTDDSTHPSQSTHYTAMMARSYNAVPPPTPSTPPSSSVTPTSTATSTPYQTPDGRHPAEMPRTLINEERSLPSEVSAHSGPFVRLPALGYGYEAMPAADPQEQGTNMTADELLDAMIRMAEDRLDGRRRPRDEHGDVEERSLEDEDKRGRQQRDAMDREDRTLMPNPDELPPVPEEPEELGAATASPGCPHTNTTRRGTNAYRKVLRCLDCGTTLSDVKVTAKDMQTKDQSKCSHERKDWRGTTGHRWQWTCRDCGQQEYGEKAVGVSGRAAASSASAEAPMSAPTGHGDNPAVRISAEDVDKTMELMQMTIDLHREMGGHVDLIMMDTIYARCRDRVMLTSLARHADERYRIRGPRAPSSPEYLPTSPTPSPAGAAASPTGALPALPPGIQHETVLESGAHRGETFGHVYLMHSSYVKLIVSKHARGDLTNEQLKVFALYCQHVNSGSMSRPAPTARLRGSGSTAHMAYEEQEHLAPPLDEFDARALLDTGCNNTCHGADWMRRFIEVCGYEPPLEPTSGSFKGLGGQVEVLGIRHLPVTMKALDGTIIHGVIASTELERSGAPLLISSPAQKRLGLVLDMGEGTVYSKLMDKEIEIETVNGMPAIRLWPGALGPHNVAMTSQGGDEAMRTSDYFETMDEHTEELIGEYEDDQPSTEDEVEDMSLRHLPLSGRDVKVLTKGQRKHLQYQLEDLEKEDAAMWGALTDTPKRAPRLLPRGCRSFLMEVFAGAATLTYLAAQMNLPVSAPVDIEYDTRYDLLDPRARQRLSQVIEDDDPYLLSFAPVCTAWSNWQYMNMHRYADGEERVMAERKKWYPVLKWMAGEVRKRLQKGREVLVENPWGSQLWHVKCISELIQSGCNNQMTGEELELIYLDQCAYGLHNPQTGQWHRKPTGLMVSSKEMKKRLQRCCDGTHWHEPLEGGQTRKAQQWPEPLCREMLKGAIAELQKQVMYSAYAGVVHAEERASRGELDGIFEAADVAEPEVKRRRMNLEELTVEEDLEDAPPEVEQLLHFKEKERRAEWTKIPKVKRVALRRLHHMFGHCTNATLARMLRNSMVGADVIRAARYLRCQVCEEMKDDAQPRVAAPTKEASKLDFNHELSLDAFEVKDSQGQRHTILSMVCTATKFHVARRVANGGVPSSAVCADAINTSWINWAGAPKVLVVDQGVHNKGKVSALMKSHNVEVRQVGVGAPHQLGVGERQGGLLKAIMKTAIVEKEITGAEAINWLCAEATRTKNCLVNHGGFSPSQWVLGQTPVDVTSMIDGEPEQSLGLQQQLVDATGDESYQDKFTRQLVIRQAAKEAYMKVDSSVKLRKALLRKSVPMRGPFVTGDLVMFRRRQRWFGPARVLSAEGRSSLWLLHSGVTILVAETSCRPAGAQEIYSKHILDLRPSRKRERDLEMDDADEMPFSSDLDRAVALRRRYDGQAPFVDIQMDEQDDPMEGPVVSPPTTDLPGVPLPPGLHERTDDLDGEGQQGQVDLPPSNGVSEGTSTHSPGAAAEVDIHMPDGTGSLPVSIQPESEISPGVSRQSTMPEDSQQDTELTSSLRRSPDQLDGHPTRHANAVVFSEDKRWAFVLQRQEGVVHKKAKTYRKKNVKKAGAGRELHYEKEQIEVREKLDETRLKEWTNWQKYTNGRWISEDELQQMKSENAKVRVIPTRWVDTDKAEVGEEPRLKSRLVVRGDLENSDMMRTDSPTASSEMLSLVLIKAACDDTDLHSGDISAAFLQGSKLDRTLVLSMPRGGIPGETPGRYYVVDNTVYGTKDAPRGWFKNLHSTILKNGLRPVPHESAAYSLRSDDGVLEGLVVVHVDDLLWTGTPRMNQIMRHVAERYKFGKLETNVFRYCGREIKKDEKGVHVTCPSLIDRVRGIQLSVEEKRNKKGLVSEAVRGQLRSVGGSLAWLARVCRPDLSYSVSKLQSDVYRATNEDAMQINALVNYVKKTRDWGLTYPLRAFDFTKASVISINDASFANDHEINSQGKKLGFRSQSGRLLCLGPCDFTDTFEGCLMPVSWHSTSIKRVCRSTLQAETLSLQLGSDEAERLRLTLHGLTRDHPPDDRSWVIEAMDTIRVLWLTDCNSLYQYVNQPGVHAVADKRLAIDLSGLRQYTWRLSGEEYGDPLLTDRIPVGATTVLKWINTQYMPADALTKQMKPGILRELMQGTCLDLRPALTPVKQYGCENEADAR